MERSAKNIEDLYTTIVAELMSAQDQDCVSKWDSLARVHEVLEAIAVEKDRLADCGQVRLSLGFAELYDEETGEKSKASFIDAIVTCPDLTEIVVSKQVKVLI